MLEDHSDLLSRLSQFLCWKIREDLSVYGDGSARRSLKQVDASHQCGFSGTGESDVDITAMALQALAPYQQQYPEVIDAALNVLSAAQTVTGGFESWGAQSSESCAQVILALTALGGGGMAAAALLALWRYYFVAKKQFGGITGDLAGWFLQKAELWMLAALCACQWGGLL